MSLSKLKSGCWLGCTLFWRLWRRVFLCPFQLLEAAHDLICDFLSFSKPRWLVECFSHRIALTLMFLPCFSTFKKPCDYLGPMQVIWDNHSIFKAHWLVTWIPSASLISFALEFNLFTGPRFGLSHVWWVHFAT